MDTLRDNNATPPDRLNEDWRFGRPHRHAEELLKLLAERAGDEGDISIQASGSIGNLCIGGTQQEAAEYAPIGSGYLVQKALEKSTERLELSLAGEMDPEHPFIIRCEVRGLYIPTLCITIEPGTHAHILEQHVHSGDSALLCLRRYTVMPGASLTLELQEQGCGGSRAMNVTHLDCRGACRLRHLTTHTNHAWAREETTATLRAENDAAPELLLLSANRLQSHQWLDQRTLQRHLSPGAKSRLLYKNVLDEQATAIFGGNIRVEPAAHDTDAYLSNLNLMLSESCTMHSMPGLEILADRVRCSHGSATAPMDPEQLFYLLSRGIDEPAARTLLANGFLANVRDQFQDEKA